MCAHDALVCRKLAGLSSGTLIDGDAWPTKSSEGRPFTSTEGTRVCVVYFKLFQSCGNHVVVVKVVDVGLRHRWREVNRETKATLTTRLDREMIASA